ncbi:MAG TPA: hypothetical protein VGE74_29650 [Gemmata sp.]
MVSAPNNSDTKTKDSFTQMNEAGVFMHLEFKPNGVLTIGIGANKPELLELIKATAPDKKIAWDAKYKLLSGDGVELYDLPKDMQSGGSGLFGKSNRGRVVIKIVGDDMTMTDQQGTGRLTRMK